MSIGLLDRLARDPAQLERPAAGRGAPGTFKVGETFELQVLERVDNRHYRVVLGNSVRTVQSATELTPGSRLSVRIAAVGEQLVLHSADPRVAAMALQEAAASESGAAERLSKLARRHRVALDGEQAALVERAMLDAEDPQAMAAAGLFLGKLGMPLDTVALQAIYEAQVWPSPVPTRAASSHLRRLDDAEQLSATLLQHFADDARIESPSQAASHLENELPVPMPDVAHSRDDATGREARRHLAQRLLNTSDAGGTGYQYGSLPLLIADQLVELDVVCFHSPTPAVPAGLRSLTMTFNSRALGRIEVSARSLGAGLVLNFRAAGAAPSEVLAAHAEEVRSLVARLGWQVESLSYDHAASPRAATQLVRHVLDTATLDRLL